MKTLNAIFARFRTPPPTPGELSSVYAFLRRLIANDGFLFDGDEGPDWGAFMLALRLGYADSGSGWNVGTRITRKGEVALAAYEKPIADRLQVVFHA